MAVNQPYTIFTKSLFGVGFILLLSFSIFFRGTKKNEFQYISGKITYLDKIYEDLPIRNHGKYRYLSLDNYPKIFEIFIGKDFGDFKPAYENIDSLKLGDEIIIYYDEIPPNRSDSRVNSLLQFLDKKDKPYFIRGDIDKYFGSILFICGLAIGIWLMYLKNIGKII